MTSATRGSSASLALSEAKQQKRRLNPTLFPLNSSKELTSATGISDNTLNSPLHRRRASPALCQRPLALGRTAARRASLSPLFFKRNVYFGKANVFTALRSVCASPESLWKLGSTRGCCSRLRRALGRTVSVSAGTCPPFKSLSSSPHRRHILQTQIRDRFKSRFL